MSQLGPTMACGPAKRSDKTSLLVEVSTSLRSPQVRGASWLGSYKHEFIKHK
ncbi:hypothetical protein RchiOBHm_Chr4g0418151 [Rosa chinensis]|uniref:Uncharacterized protein n=1 Tax=Rosa chinensis TaxID=74649 RepID=A0A2P6QX96_ROSCH|nr:hypothetical protein RchiOBHm_Chr4g0418151 [Rosa chinensis]